MEGKSMAKQILKYTLIFLLVSLYSCKGEGIFYTLRDEIEIENAKFSDDATITSIFTIYDSSSVLHSIAAGAVIWERTENTGWNRLPYPANMKRNETYVTSIASYQDNIYAVFRNKNIGESYIYYYNLDNNTWTNALASALPVSSDTYYLFSDPEDGSWLYINQRGYGENSAGKHLYSFNSVTLDFASAIVSLNGSVDIPRPVISIDFDGSNYRLISNSTLISGSSNLYISTDGTTFTIDANVDADQLQTVKTVSTSSGDLILLGKKMGAGLEYYTPSGTWNNLSIGSIDGDFSLYNFTDLNPANGSIPDYIICGIYNISNKNDQGYILLDYSDPENLTVSSVNISDNNNYNSSELPNSAVNGIIQLFIGATQDYKLYAASNNGIWSFSSQTSLWKQE